MQASLRITAATIAVPALTAGALAVVVPGLPALAVLAGVIFLAAATVWPMLAWSLVVLAYPFIYLQIFIGETINVPYVDLFALFAFVGTILHLVIRWRVTGRRPHLGVLPGLIPFVAFIAVGAFSLLNLSSAESGSGFASGVKYLIRPLVFFYLMYVMLPALVIDRPRRLFTTFRLLFLVGGLVAAMGIWSLIFPPEPGVFRRAVPIIIYGMTPLGTNHNLIAEVLVSVIPIGIILAYYARGIRRRWYVIGTVAFAIVNLLTFSRNGWLTLAIESAVLLAALARIRGVSFRRVAVGALPIVAAAVVIIAIFSATSVAQSSNINRLRLTEIALAQFREHPLIGAGVGTFMEAVQRDRWYIADFGKPQEAHGLVQKLLAETGALGLLTFLWLLGAILAYLGRVYVRARSAPAWRFILLALICATAGSIVFQLFNTSYFVSKLWLFLGVAVAAARLAERGIALRMENR